MLPILVMIMMLVFVKAIILYGDHYDGDDCGDHMVMMMIVMLMMMKTLSDKSSDLFWRIFWVAERERL